MTKPMVRIHDLATDKIIDREMTHAEFAIHEANQVSDAAAQATAQAEAETQATAKAALLARLGITADEAKLLLG